MKLAFLGDVYDHWKGSIIDLLGDTLNNLHVVPLLTDAENWTEDHFRVYALLLRVDADCILRKRCNFEKLRESRYQYFAELAGPSREGVTESCDLFLDPDTGIGKRDRSHVWRDDIDQLLQASGSRILLIYTHEDRGASEVDALNTMRKAFGESRFFAYRSAKQHLSMAFVGRDECRLTRARARFSSVLGPVAAERLIGQVAE